MKRKLIILVYISLAFASCATKSRTVSHNTLKDKSTTVSAYSEPITLQDSIIHYGLKYLNAPYRSGGKGSRSFDCSGYTAYVYRNFGYNLGASSRDQATQFPSIKREELRPGDLVFFEGRAHNGRVGHVGIVTEGSSDGGFNFIHASLNQGVTISSSSEPYYASRYLKAGRVIEKNNSYKNNNYTAKKEVKQENIIKNEKVKSAKKKQEEIIPENQPIERNIFEPQYHTVKKGETLASIAKQYDVPISTLQMLNNNLEKVKPNTQILVSEAVKYSPAVSRQTIDINQDKPLAEPVKPVTNEPVQPIVETKKTTPALQLVMETPSEPRKAVSNDNRVSQIQAQKYQVYAGESLFAIAKKHNMTVEQLKSLNNLDSDNLKAGQILMVNTSDAVVQNEDIKKTDSKQPTVHYVKKGDTLYSIAKQYHCTINDLKKWNEHLTDAVKIGEKINILK